MIQVASINIQSKIKINGLLSDSFALIQEFHQGCPLSMLLWIIVAEVLAIFIDADTRIKGIQIGDHEIKIVNFAYDTTIFLRDFSCLTKIELIFELSQKSSSSKINSQKARPYEVWHIKIELINQNKWPNHNFLSKWLEFVFIILPLITGTGTKYITI